MRSFLTITTPAADLTLLTIEEMRAAAGVTGSGSDSELRAMEKRIAASITSECGIAIGGGSPPTLRRETITETIYQACGEKLFLSRRHDIDITSVVEDGVTLVDTDFVVDAEYGGLLKLCNDYPAWWSAKKITIIYNAGFGTVPDDLKAAAIDFFRASWQEQNRDSLLKSEVVDVPGVLRTEKDWWVGSVPGQTHEGAVPDIVAGQLKRFRSPWIG